MTDNEETEQDVKNVVLIATTNNGEGPHVSVGNDRYELYNGVVTTERVKLTYNGMTKIKITIEGIEKQ